MSIQDKLIAKYGNPMKSAADKLTFEKKWMELHVYPENIRKAIPALGEKIYINKDFYSTYIRFLSLLIERNLHGEIHANDECFMPRYQRGSTTQISIHTWGLAVDLNPLDNPIYSTREQCIAKGLKPFTKEFIQAGRDAGLICGADFPGRPDLMHFEGTKGLY
jgi:hypothetical protein